MKVQHVKNSRSLALTPRQGEVVNEMSSARDNNEKESSMIQGLNKLKQ